MDFRTEIQLSPGEHPIDHGTQILCLGSCFADRIGQQLQQNRFSVKLNPFGVIFHPIPLLRLLEGALDHDESEVIANLFQHEDQWKSFSLHSQFNGREQKEVEQNIRQTFEAVRQFLEKADVLILTFGTAWAWEKTGLGLVANNHRWPLQDFCKKRSSPEEIADYAQSVLQKLRGVRPDLRVICTVSPVRHTRQGLPENMLSKSILRLACQQLTEKLTFCDYFPAFEILLDDLRDYRFYGPDMIHPTSVAEDYVFERFAEVYFPQETQRLIRDWQQLKRSLDHRPFDPSGKAYQEQLNRMLVQAQQLARHMDLHEVIGEISQRLKA